MNYLILALENGSYIFKESSDTSMETLAWFLLYDATTSDIKWLKEWLFNKERDIKAGNTTSLEKFEKKIFITPDINEKDDEFEISINGFVDLLNRWSLLQQQKPKRIIITKEGDTVTIEGKD